LTHNNQAIAHIGYHKTATTWFQKRFYPLVTSHRALPRKTIKEALIHPHAFAFDPQAGREHLGLDRGPPAILCEEELSGSFETGGLMGALSKELAERLHRVLPHAQIVVFIRHQVDVIAAAYAQYVKRGGTHGPEHFLFPARYRKAAWRRPYKKPLFFFEHFSYIGLIRHYQALFGTDNVHVFAYEGFRRNPHDFLADYTDCLGLSIDLGRIDFSEANASFRHRTLRLARLLNSLTYRGTADKQYLLPLGRMRHLDRLLGAFNNTALAGHRPSPRTLLGHERVAYIERFYAESNRVLARETGLPLAAYGYPGTAGQDSATRRPE